MKYCMHCSSPMPDNAAFCVNCGQPACASAPVKAKRRKNGLGIAGFTVSIVALAFSWLSAEFGWMLIVIALGLSVAGFITGLAKKRRITLSIIGIILCLAAAALAIFVAPNLFSSDYTQLIPELGDYIQA